VKGIELLSDKYLELEKNSGDRVESEDEIQVLRKNIKEKLKAQQAEEDKRKEKILLMQQQQEQRAEQDRKQSEEMRALDSLQASLEQQLNAQKEKERLEVLEREKLRFLKKMDEDKLLTELNSKLEQEKQEQLQYEEKMRQEKSHQENLLREKLQAEKQRQEEQGRIVARQPSKSSFTCLSDLDEFMSDLDIIVTTRSFAEGTSDLQSRIDQEKELRRVKEERERELTLRIAEMEQAQQQSKVRDGQMHLSLDRPTTDEIASPRRGLSPERAGSPIALSPRLDDATMQREELERQEQQQRDRKEQERQRKQARRDHQELHGREALRKSAHDHSALSKKDKEDGKPRARSQSPQPRSSELSPREKETGGADTPTRKVSNTTDFLDLLKYVF
jgi:hypothetical protein